MLLDEQLCGGPLDDVHVLGCSPLNAFANETAAPLRASERDSLHGLLGVLPENAGAVYIDHNVDLMPSFLPINKILEFHSWSHASPSSL